MSGLYHKHFLKSLDFTLAELNSLLQLAAKLKVDKKSGKEEARLTNKNVALIFEKDSTRTRYSLEVATYDQGVRITYLGPSGSQIDRKESVKDTARVFGRMCDDIQYCGYGQEVIKTPAEYAGVPVWNNLTNEFHPTQLLADLLIIQEHLPGKAFNEVTLVYAGDVRSSMGSPMLEATVLIGLDLRLVAPQACWPEAVLVAECSALTQKHEDKITSTEDIASGIKGADFICTDVWVSMDRPKERRAEHTALLCDYQVNNKVVTLTGNSQVKFLYCLPAFRDKQATPGKEMAAEFGLYGGMEITDEVFESPAGIIFDQTEDRMHTTKAVVVATLTK